MSPADLALVDRIVAEVGSADSPGALLAALERLQAQNAHRYLPVEVLRHLALRTGLPLSRIYSVATFFAIFNLEPQGEHTVSVCRGTACHTRGSRTILETLKLDLGVQAPNDEGGTGQVSLTTPDGRFTLRTVACFGQCALAPVVEIDGEIHGHVTERTVEQAIQTLQSEKAEP